MHSLIITVSPPTPLAAGLLPTALLPGRVKQILPAISPPLLVLVKRFMAVIKCSEAARAVIKDYLPKIPGHNRASIIGIRPAFTFIKVKFRLGKAGRQQEGNPKTSRLICFRP